MNTDQRSYEDRRQRHVKAFFYQFLRARRRNPERREGDSHGFHVDYHDRRYFVVSLTILALCITDVYATITLLNRGSTEINPLMRSLVEYNPGLFFAFKYVATSFGIFILLSFRKFHILGNMTTMNLLYAILIFYLLLVFYEVVLLSAT